MKLSGDNRAGSGPQAIGRFGTDVPRVVEGSEKDMQADTVQLGTPALLARIMAPFGQREAFLTELATSIAAGGGGSDPQAVAGSLLKRAFDIPE